MLVSVSLPTLRTDYRVETPQITVGQSTSVPSVSLSLSIYLSLSICVYTKVLLDPGGSEGRSYWRGYRLLPCQAYLLLYSSPTRPETASSPSVNTPRALGGLKIRLQAAKKKGEKREKRRRRRRRRNKTAVFWMPSRLDCPVSGTWSNGFGVWSGAVVA